MEKKESYLMNVHKYSLFYGGLMFPGRVRDNVTNIQKTDE